MRGRLRRRSLILCLIVGIAATPVQGADESASLGSRVRIHTIQPDCFQTGFLEARMPEGLVVRLDGVTAPVMFHHGDVAKLEVSGGMKRRTLKGLVIGALAWAAIVGAEAAFDTLDESGVGEPLFVGGILAAGAGIGSVVKTERWQRVPTSSASISPGSRGRGIEMKVVVRF